MRCFPQGAPSASVTRDATYGDLAQLAGGILRALPTRDSGSEVVVLCRDRLRFAASLWAAWSAGFTVALPPSAQHEVLRALRGRPGIATVLHDEDGMPGIDVRTLDRGTALAPVELDPERRIVVVYTSGSTGESQPCAKTTAQLFDEVAALIGAFGFEATDRFVATVPPHHIYGLLFGLLVPLQAGARMAIETVLHAEPLAALMRREDATVLVAVPAHLATLEGFAHGALGPSLRRIVSSGAALPAEVAARVEAAFGFPVTEVLGSSETGGIAWRAGRSGTAGAFQPLPGVRVSIVDGCLAVDSPFLDPALARPWRTADRAVLTEGGFVHLGRKDGVVKVAGTRVALQELEARIRSLPRIRDVALGTTEVGGLRGVEIRALVVADGWTRETLRSELAKHFDAVVLPRKIRFVESLPRDPNGKLRKDALDALWVR